MLNCKFRSYIKPWWCVLHEKLHFYNNEIILVLRFRLFIYSYYYGEKVFIINIRMNENIADKNELMVHLKGLLPNKIKSNWIEIGNDKSNYLWTSQIIQS